MATKTPATAPKTERQARLNRAAEKVNGKSEIKKLSAPQIRILTALKSGKPLTRAQIVEKAEIDPTAVGNQAGYVDPEVNDRPVHSHNLSNRKFVKLEIHEDTGVTYTITALGKKALETALAAAK